MWNWIWKKKIIVDIIDYILQISEKCYYYNNQKVKISYAKKFFYYLDNNHEELEKICINFHSTNQIKTWIHKTLNDMYNDIDFTVDELKTSQSSQLSNKYESVKRRTSNISIISENKASIV